MSLAPYKITAIKYFDSDGLNVKASAQVSIYNQNSELVTVYSNAAYGDFNNPFNLDQFGERQIWLQPGIYQISVNGGQLWDVSIGGATTTPIIWNATASINLDLIDAGAIMMLTNEGTKEISVYEGAGAAEVLWSFRNVGAGVATFNPVGAVTITPNAGGSLSFPQHGTVSILCTAGNQYILFGQTVAA